MSQGELYPIGTKVRHKKYPELIGKVFAHEYARPGVLSALPYCVHWTDSNVAYDSLGILSVYPNSQDIEEVIE